MKYLRIALLLLPIAALCARAADEDAKSNPEEDIPDFSNLDEFIYQPKSNATLGMRYISGVKTTFSGNGYLAAPETIPSLTPLVGAPTSASGYAGVTVGTGGRDYHDGYVDPDTRSETVANANGTTSQVPIPADGKTNQWSYDTNGQENAAGTGTTSQVVAGDYMQFHIYSATSEDNVIHDHPGKGTTGVELASNHDMGKIGSHITWTIFGGVTLNDIESSTFGNVNAAVTTVTDTYDLFGQTVPNGPYTAPSTVSQNIISNGQILVNSAGTPVTETIDTTTLLGTTPLSRTTTTATDDVSVADHWKLHGAYLTFRAGPALTYNFNDHLKFTFSAGPALIDASSTYTVTEVLTPNTGAQIIGTFQDIEDKVLPAAYADATLEYDITDRAGLYLGAFYQVAGNYEQTVSGYAEDSNDSTGSWQTKVDFGGQEGLRGGMSFRF